MLIRFLSLSFQPGFQSGPASASEAGETGPGCPPVPWSTLVQEAAEGQVPGGGGSAQVWTDPEYSFSCVGRSVRSYKSVELLSSLRRLPEYLFSDDSLFMLKHMSDC